MRILSGDDRATSVFARKCVLLNKCTEPLFGETRGVFVVVVVVVVTYVMCVWGCERPRYVCVCFALECNFVVRVLFVVKEPYNFS